MKKNYYMHLSKLFMLLVFFIPALLNAQAIKDSIRKNYTQKDYENFVLMEMRGEIPSGKGLVSSQRSTGDALVNNNVGATGTSGFTQSETSILAFGSNVVIGFNDAGSYGGVGNKFTGFSYSSDGGATFTDGGTLPTNVIGDAGDPVLARNESTGRIYFTTLGFSSPSTIQVFMSDDNGITWSAPVNGTPGGSSEDKQWIAVDNFAGSGNGNVYLISRRFAGTQGIYVFRSTDNGATFGPNGGVQIVSGQQGAFVVVGPDHSVYAFWYNGTTIQMRKSTDQGLTFGAAVIVASGLTGGVNGDLALTGLRQGTATYSGFRSSEFPHVAVNPVNGDLYVTYDNNPAGADKADVFMSMSTDGGATWGAPVLINDDGTTTDQWQPTIAVTPDGSNLGIFYYSRQGDEAGNNLITYNGRKAVISGSTVSFTPSFVISDVQSLPEFGRDAFINSVYMGDYNSAAATATDFHVVWSDNRDDLAGGAPRKDPNVYYKSIPVGLLAGPNISVSPSNVGFGSIVVGESGGPIQVTITNTGDADLTVSAISSPAPDFSISTPSLPAVIPSLGFITVDVSFDPLSLGLQNSSFDISSDAANDPLLTVDLSGTGITNILVSPLLVDFGDVPVGVSVGPVPVSIQNLGGSDLTVSAISSPGGDFSISHSSLPIVIPGLGNATVDVSFAPLIIGAQAESFDISSDAFETPTVTVGLQGSGIEAPLNDFCANAIPLDCGASIDGTTVLASFDNVGTCGTSNTAPGVWYSIIGTGNPISLSTCSDASFDTKISVFEGSCGALSCVGGNDDACPGFRSTVTFNSVYGTTYYVLVHGFASATGTFTLSTSQCPAEIEVAPAALTFTVPLNGSASDQLTISNIAGSDASDLEWLIINSENLLSPSTNASFSSNQAYEEEAYTYKVTNGTIFTLRSENLPIDVLHDLDALRSQAPTDKEAFFNSVISAIGEENTNLYYENIIESSARTETESLQLADGEYWKGKSDLKLKKEIDVPVEIYGAGGPDGGNYTWIDSDDPDGPVFNWFDITGTGTEIISNGDYDYSEFGGADDSYKQIAIPFSFIFYEVSQSLVKVSSNGYLTFGNDGTDFSNDPIPNATDPNNIICPFWDDLNPGAGGTVHYLASPTQFIVQYTNIQRFGGGLPFTFQVILNDDGTILYQYLDMQGLLTSSTIGIENATASTGLQIAFNQAYVHNNLAVLIASPAACPWITSVSPISGTISGGGSQQVTVDVDATGLPVGTYECYLTVFSNAANSDKVSVPVTLIVDNTPPVITVSDAITLWPPNGKYENLDLTELVVSVEDDVDGTIPVSSVVITSASSDEPDNAPGNGDGNTINDIVIAADCKTVDLRKERQGTGNGRVYEVHVSVADAAGNVGTATCLVTVPHDQYHAAVNDGPDHTVYSSCGGASPIAGVINSGSIEYELINYPNPFKGTATIQFTLEQSNYTKLVVYNSLGREVATLFDGMAESDQVYKVEFKAFDLPAGVYFYHLQSGDSINIMKKMMLIK